MLIIGFSGKHPSPSDERTTQPASIAAARLGFPLPAGVQGRDLIVIGIIGGIGFTVALFVSGEAFADPALQNVA